MTKFLVELGAIICVEMGWGWSTGLGISPIRISGTILCVEIGGWGRGKGLGIPPLRISGTILFVEIGGWGWGWGKGLGIPPLRISGMVQAKHQLENTDALLACL